MLNEISIKNKAKNCYKLCLKKINHSAYDGNIRWDVNGQFICVTENWMRKNYDDRFKECSPMKDGEVIVVLEDDNGVDDPHMAKSINRRPCHLGCYITGQ